MYDWGEYVINLNKHHILILSKLIELSKNIKKHIKKVFIFLGEYID